MQERLRLSIHVAAGSIAIATWIMILGYAVYSML